MKSFAKWSLIFGLAHLFAVAVIYGDEPKAFEPSDQQVLLHAEAQRHRVANGRDAQTLDAECCLIAQSHAERMASARSMFHGPADQIVAYGYATPVAAVRVWIGSPPHNAWLLSSTRRAGWGAAQSSGGTWYWAGAFRGSTAAGTGTTSYGGRRRWFGRWFGR